MTETQPTREEKIQTIGEAIGNYSVIYSDIVEYVACETMDNEKKECIEMCLCTLWTKKESTLKVQNDDCIEYVYNLCK